MQVTYKCERCGIDKTIEIKIPKMCSKECRLIALGERQKARKAARLANKQMEEQTVTGIPVNPDADAGVPVTPSEENSNTPESMPLENGDTPTTPEPESAPETPTDNPGGENNPTDIGQGTPGEDRMETPSQPADNPGQPEGQA